MRLFPTLSIALPIAALLSATPVAASAAPVQRCVTAEGRTVFTDRRCEDIGAVSRIPVPGSRAGSTGATRRGYAGGCPRTLSALVGEIGGAVQAGDVNRLSSIYDWSGTSDAAARRILDRLEAVVERPLVDIAPVMPADPGPSVHTVAASVQATAPVETSAPPPPPPHAAWMPSWAGTGAATQATVAAPASGDVTAVPAPQDAAGPAPTPHHPRPVALRLEQTLAGTATPARTVFGLRRNFGCFWISL